MEYLLGIVVSLIVEGVKKYSGADSFMVHITLFLVSLAGALAFVYFSANTALWQVFLQVVVAAAAFHNLILRKFESA